MISKKMIVMAVAGSLVFVSDAAEQQPSKPPVAQVWIDLSTVSSNMPNMGAMRGGPGAMLGSLFGGGKDANGGNTFGNTRMMMMGGAGRWMDVTLMTHNNPSLQTATQAVPDGSKLAPTLALVSPEGTPPPPVVKAQPHEEEEPAPEFKQPKGKILLYWGCSSTVRQGQPRVLDMANAQPQDFAAFFQSRHATTKGTHSTPGQPIWPNKTDSRMIAPDASLVGEHTFTGDGVPDGFKVSIDPGHDLMPAIDLSNHDDDTSTILNWQAIGSARAYFLSAMGTRGEGEMVIWTSSELPDFGMGLIDYQPNGSIDTWLKEKVLLQPTVTQCAVPKEVLGQHGMIRMIAYGNEMDVAYPARPKNPKQTWEPQWAAKVRLKSVTMSILGMQNQGRDRNTNNPNPDSDKPKDQTPTPLNVLKGLFGH
ncbi:MAG TPA: hypothetical protein VIF60_07980 [Burkholderiaceae bacterium]